MIQREKSGAQTGQIIDAIEEFSLSAGRQIASELFRNFRKNGSSKSVRNFTEKLRNYGAYTRRFVRFCNALQKSMNDV